MLTVRAWTRGSRKQAMEQLLPLLRARIDAVASEALTPTDGAQRLRRRYTLAPTAKLFDLRLHKSTSRLDQVLKGHLEPFLILAK